MLQDYCGYVFVPTRYATPPRYPSVALRDAARQGGAKANRR